MTSNLAGIAIDKDLSLEAASRDKGDAMFGKVGS